MSAIPLAPRPASAPPWWSGRILLAIVAIVAVLTLGCLPLVDEDEGEYSEIASELARSPNWLAPTLNGHAFYEKPILLFWLQAPLVRLAGPAEWAFRLPSALCTVAWAVLLMRWWGRRRNPRAATIAAWLAVTCAGMVVVGRAATMDALVVLLLTGTLLALWEWLEQGRRTALWQAALLAGLGVLAKGPLALVVPGLVLLSFLAVTPAFRSRWRGLLDPVAWLILVTVAAPWYVWYGQFSQGEFLRYFLWRENVGRLGGSLQGHGGSVLYYLPVLPLLLLPHGGVLVALVRA
ncbi:MAG: glycosyltransferase family 39 protein, partial [Pseudomonadota bacterium]|nr:glycosyltransferase family 39 protein [Pseudomonadota bacterium]